MGNLAQKKNGVSPSLCPIEIVSHNQHIVLDGTTSPTWKESQIKSISQRRFEERSQQLRDGSYPLHMAIVNGAPMQVLEMLAKAAPEVASMTDKYGQTCLHLLVLKYGGRCTHTDGADSNPDVLLDAVKLVMPFDKGQIMVKDKADRLPLHVACGTGCSIDVAKFLVDAYPDSIGSKNSDGNSPLEVAIDSGRCSKELIGFLSELEALVVEVPQ